MPNDGSKTISQPEIVERDPQVVAVGVNESKKLNKAPLSLKAKHFRPRPEGCGRMALSTYCVDDLDDAERWQLLELHVKPAVVARAELFVKVIRDAQLTVDSDWDPDRHVNVIGWPESDEAITTLAMDVLFLAQKPFLRTG